MTGNKKAKKAKGSHRGLSIGEASMRLGVDVRDLLTIGYTPEQIDGVLDGEYTLDELLKTPPDNTQTRQ